jgi:hypothetical protein
MKLLIKAILYPASLWIALLYFQGEKYPKEFYADFQKPVKRQSTVNTLDDYIRLSAEHHGINPDLIDAVIRVESSYRPQVVSHAGAIGLMQIMPATAKTVCEIEDSSLLKIKQINILKL